VVDGDRGSLPFAFVHGRPLVACAGWALEQTGVTVLDVGTVWRRLADLGSPLVLHDPLCPMTPPDFLGRCLDHAVERASVTVGVRPVTDTVKRLGDGEVGDTVDRTRLVQVVSPVVLPASVVVALDGLPTTDFAALVAALAERYPVETLPAPAEARRVANEADLEVLEALTQPPRQH